MPLAAAAPALISAGGAIGASLLGRKSVKGDTQRTPGETSAIAGQTGAANALTGQGRQLSAQGMPQLQQAGKYFSTLASGNRSAMTQTLAPQIEATNDVYSGTTRSLSRFLRGPEKDLQLAEAERGRAGAVSSLFRSGRANAAGALASMGQSSTGQAAANYGTAGSIFGQQEAAGRANRFGGAELEHQAGSDFGGLVFNLLKNYAGTSGRGGGGGGYGMGPMAEQGGGG